MNRIYTDEELNRPMRLLPKECIEFMKAEGFVIRTGSTGLPSVYHPTWRESFREKFGM